MATTRREQATAGSDTIVGVSVEAQLQRALYPEEVKTTQGKPGTGEKTTGQLLSTAISTSAMAAGTDLNGPAVLSRPQGLRIQIPGQNADKLEKRLRQEIPTADLVTRSSFKVDSKLLIKIVPSPKRTKLGKYIPELTFDAFSLQSIAEPDAERYQLHETFEDFVLFMFGRRPRIWTMQGIVVNGRRPPDAAGEETQKQEQERLATDMDWANSLLRDWDDFYRGSKSVEAGALTYLAYEDSVIEATLLELTMVRNSQLPAAVNATLTFVVHQRAFVGQEYREGFTSPSLAQLVADTNNNKFFADKVSPSEILPTSITAEELARQRRLAEAELLASRAAAEAAAKEREEVETSLNEDKDALDDAEVQKARAEGDIGVIDAQLEAGGLTDAEIEELKTARTLAAVEKVDAENKIKHLSSEIAKKEDQIATSDQVLIEKNNAETDASLLVDTNERIGQAIDRGTQARDEAWAVTVLANTTYPRYPDFSSKIVITDFQEAGGEYIVSYNLPAETGSGYSTHTRLLSSSGSVLQVIR